MAAKTYLTYDGDPANGIAPFRPGLDDLGGASLIDDQEYPPDPETQPTADAWNQMVRQHVAHSKVTPVAVISVRFAAGVPVVDLFSAAGDNIDAGDLTLTDNGSGDTDITWPADSFPVQTARPSGLTINEDVAIDEMRAIPIANGVRVVTKSSAAGGGQDAAFTVEIWGQ